MLDCKTLMLVAAVMVRQRDDATIAREHSVARLFGQLLDEFWPLLDEQDQVVLHALKGADRLPPHLAKAVP